MQAVTVIIVTVERKHAIRDSRNPRINPATLPQHNLSQGPTADVLQAVPTPRPTRHDAA
jgi:hypothetical protein